MQHTEFLKYEFTEDELKQFAKELARQNTIAAEAEEEKKAVVAQFTEKVAGAKTTISKLSRYINNGYEYRTIDCEVQMHTPHSGTKRISRKDTGELVKEVPMTHSELQEELPLQIPNDSSPGSQVSV